MADFDKSIDLDPNYFHAYNNRGACFMKLGKYQEALKDFDKAIEEKEDYGSAYLNRGIVKELLYDLEGACKDWTAAMDLGVFKAKKYIEDLCVE